MALPPILSYGLSALMGPCYGFGGAPFHEAAYSAVSRLPLFVQAEVASRGYWTAIEAFTQTHIYGNHYDIINERWDDSVYTALDRCVRDKNRKRFLPEIIAGIGKGSFKKPRTIPDVVRGLIRFSPHHPAYLSYALPVIVKMLEKTAVAHPRLPGEFANTLQGNTLDNPFVVVPYIDRLCAIANLAEASAHQNELGLRHLLGHWVAMQAPGADVVEKMVPGALMAYIHCNHTGQYSTLTQVQNAYTQGVSALDLAERFVGQPHQSTFDILLALSFATPKPGDDYMRVVLEKAFEKNAIRASTFPMIVHHFPNLISLVLEEAFKIVCRKENGKGNFADAVGTDSGTSDSGVEDVWLAILGDILRARYKHDKGRSGIDPVKLFRLAMDTRGAGRTGITIYTGVGREDIDRQHSPVFAAQALHAVYGEQDEEEGDEIGGDPALSASNSQGALNTRDRNTS
ncbi:MAG: hypothetical protein Q7T03_01265 [Deltaproteobacteria bacterium]|nr:hypothetical protein [Deltaproteobacteria bacterium]